MGYTIAEKILAAHAGGKPVRAGDVVVASVDFAMLHDARFERTEDDPEVNAGK